MRAIGCASSGRYESVTHFAGDDFKERKDNGITGFQQNSVGVLVGVGEIFSARLQPAAF